MVKFSPPSRWIVILCSFSYSLAGPVQIPNLKVPASAAANQQAVKDIFLQSYSAYRYMFGVVSV